MQQRLIQEAEQCDTRVKHTLLAKQLHFGEEFGFKNYPFNGSLCKHPFLKKPEAIVSTEIISSVFNTTEIPAAVGILVLHG